MAEESSRPNPKSLRISDAGLRTLKDREGGFYAEPYQDAGGLAIGYGMQTWKGKKVTPGLRITQAEADAEMRRQVDEQYGSYVRNTLTVPVSQNQYDALVSLAYNSPKAAINLAERLNKGKPLTEEHFKASGTVEGKPHKGLQARRSQEYAQFVGQQAEPVVIAPTTIAPPPVVEPVNVPPAGPVSAPSVTPEPAPAPMEPPVVPMDQSMPLSPQQAVFQRGARAPGEERPAVIPLDAAIASMVERKRGTTPEATQAVSLDDAIARMVARKSGVSAKPADSTRTLLGFPKTVPTEPSAGYWEDRGIAGKVWHPATPPAEKRKDTNLIGFGSGADSAEPDAFAIAPEEAIFAGRAGYRVAKAVAQKGLSLAGRAAAGGTAMAGEVVPIVKFEVAQQALKAAGVPEPFATIGAGVFAARGGKKGAPAAEAKAATGAVQTPQPPVSEGIGRTKQAAADWRAAQGIPTHGRPSAGSPAARAGATVIEPPASRRVVAVDSDEVANEIARRRVTGTNAPAAEKAVVEKAQKLKLHEVLMGMKLRKAGLGEDKIKEVIDELGKLPLSWQKLPTDAEVASIVKQANEAGRMVR